MTTSKFKTNIKCDGCVATVTPHLNKVAGENNWKVDLTDERRLLTVTSGVGENEVLQALTEAGYKGEKVQ